MSKAPSERSTANKDLEGNIDGTSYMMGCETAADGVLDTGHDGFEQIFQEGTTVGPQTQRSSYPE